MMWYQFAKIFGFTTEPVGHALEFCLEFNIEVTKDDDVPVEVGFEKVSDFDPFRRKCDRKRSRVILAAFYQLRAPFQLLLDPEFSPEDSRKVNYSQIFFQKHLLWTSVKSPRSVISTEIYSVL